MDQGIKKIKENIQHHFLLHVQNQDLSKNQKTEDKNIAIKMKNVLRRKETPINIQGNLSVKAQINLTEMRGQIIAEMKELTIMKNLQEIIPIPRSEEMKRVKKHQEEDQIVPNHRDQGQTVQLEGIDGALENLRKMNYILI